MLVAIFSDYDTRKAQAWVVCVKCLSILENINTMEVINIKELL